MDLRLGPDFELVGGLSGGSYYLGSEFELRGARGPVVDLPSVSSIVFNVASGVFSLTGVPVGMAWAASLELQTGVYHLTGYIAGIGQEIGSITLNRVSSSIEALIQSATVQLRNFFGVVAMEESQSTVTMETSGSSIEMTSTSSTITMSNETAEIE